LILLVGFVLIRRKEIDAMRVKYAKEAVASTNAE
jgi:hypothetical protein